MSASIARVTFLGTGTSHGVPMIGCECPVCTSTDPRDQRARPSILVEFEDGFTALVDTSPDLRQQALRFRFRRVDAVLFTHPHADHLLGLDDTRRFNHIQKTAIPCFGNAGTIDELVRVFRYAFDPMQHGGGVPQLKVFRVGGPFCLGRFEIVPIPIWHGRLPIFGYRVGDFAYLTDCSAIPDDSWPLLAGIRTLAIDALRERPHPTHFTVKQALEAAERIRPERTLLTHICHDLGHDATSRRLPPGVELAYDGLIVEVGA